MNADARYKNSYPPKALDLWASRATQWSAGRVASDLPRVLADDSTSPPPPTDVFVYFINGAKERAPAAAMPLLKRL